KEPHVSPVSPTPPPPCFCWTSASSLGPNPCAALCSQVCKVYRFQTEDRRWLLVREQMSETPLSFSVPKQLLSALIQEHFLCVRVRDVKELGDLSPHWNGLRHDVINHCNHLIGCYQETLAELDKLSSKSSSSKADRHLQFVPTNLHSQRMEVKGPDRVWYEVITVGAPADHHQAFKHGGLRRLLRKHHRERYPDESCRAKELLASIAQLQPLIFGLAEELLSVSSELDLARLQEVLDSLMQETKHFIHALKDELVKSALLAIHSHYAALTGSHVHANGLLCENSQTDREDDGRRDSEYDEEEWDRAWANIAKSLDCIMSMVDRLREREGHLQEQRSPEPRQTDSSPSEQLLPLVVTLRDCVREAVTKARAAMTFVVLQGALAATVAQGPVLIVQRRHAVFSQALSSVVCGFMLKLHGGLEDPEFLQQLHAVGVLAQFEGLLSTYGEEEGMLQDMEVGVADLSGVAFTITEARSERPGDLQPTLRGTWWEHFYTHTHLLCLSIFHNPDPYQYIANPKPNLNSIHTLVLNLTPNPKTSFLLVGTRLWSPQGAVCRRVNGVRLTSCKSAKDRTAMSVTLEQCAILRERHTLSQQHFSTALNSMRRDGCRMENVQKNVGNRKFAFSSVQLLTFPKLYRPPDGSYG
uniref:Type II inositol 3,4-bisphosphate 4-phosphatase-like n=1 Tax=Kryptolebias marmoratus TaxID=37003 RepID=A0A3Q3G0L0_KRYMA